jgi:hypothetical protein
VAAGQPSVALRAAELAMLLDGISEETERGELFRRIAQDTKVLNQLKEENQKKTAA